MKIGVFGGTFNPIHIAHVYIAQEYVRQLQLDRLILIPAYLPPHKSAKHLADAQDRLTMCQLAVQDLPNFTVCDYEVSQRGKSYTFKTLRHLLEVYPESELFLIMGTDMFLTVQDWRQPQQIFNMATLCAAQREQGEFTLLDAHKKLLEIQGANCMIIDMEPISLSSTAVRKLIQDGENASRYLHPAVWGYIQEKGLYQK